MRFNPLFNARARKQEHSAFFQLCRQFTDALEQDHTSDALALYEALAVSPLMTANVRKNLLWEALDCDNGQVFVAVLAGDTSCTLVSEHAFNFGPFYKNSRVVREAPVLAMALKLEARDVATHLLDVPGLRLDVTGHETRHRPFKRSVRTEWPDVATLAQQAGMPDLAVRIREMRAARASAVLDAMLALSRYAI